MPGLLLTVPYTAVQFVALHQCKEAAARLGLTGERVVQPYLECFLHLGFSFPSLHGQHHSLKDACLQE